MNNSEQYQKVWISYEFVKYAKQTKSPIISEYVKFENKYRHEIADILAIDRRMEHISDVPNFYYNPDTEHLHKQIDVLNKRKDEILNNLCQKSKF